ncbi:hypothetical protein UK15_39040 [Streptomyces variegatus]|uniref:Uncharacterized protein n=1 Tax=Streptomyces variegatus TaxID=284040 RepID=A0A0M2GBS9_9ACTN|nr:MULTISPECIES: hypothetical protein [Streptomyces]KJK33516.1 hypothetical protein UK15_39040 [Streptomyces variegatus]
MDVSWTATDPESRQFSPTERSSDFADLADHFTALRSHGQGYLEVRLPGDEFPLLTLGFLDDQAVIHLFDAAEKSSLLVGDGTATADAVLEVPIMDDLAVFSGDCVVDVDRAWALIRNFIQTRAPGELGEWREL